MGAGSAPVTRYQVFISSTFLDLKEAREEAIQAILELDCFPAGMELFPAADDEKWDLIKSVVDDSDYYILILGGRYGSVDAEGVSYTEREYDYAVQQGKPVLAFLHSDPDSLPKRDTERKPEGEASLERFRKKVSARMCKLWTTPQDLGSAVSRSLVKTIRSEPARGWVRADHALTPEYAAEVEELRARLRELEAEQAVMLDSAPPGTEAFSQGDNETELEFLTDVRFANTYQPVTYDWDVRFTWDHLFAGLGPVMMHEASDSELSKRLNSMIADAEHRELLEALEKVAREGETSVRGIGDFRIKQDSFDKVKVQLVALRLIEKSRQKHGVNDKSRYWALTPYGEAYVMRLKAERRPT